MTDPALSQFVTVLREAAAAMRAASGKAGLPLDKTLWTREEIAECLKTKSRTALEREMRKPGFPKARRIGNGRWIASEIIEWAGEQ